MGKYHRLTLDERYQIGALLQSGIGIREIARTLNRDPGTVSREVRRNSKPSRKYFAKRASELSSERRKNVGPPIKICGDLEQFVRDKILIDWSPEQISGKLELDGKPGVCHESIYKFVYDDSKKGGDLWTHLRRHRRWRRRRFTLLNFKKAGLRKERKWIEERPPEVEKRNRIGDFERDTIDGKKGGSLLMTIVDRTSRLTKIKWLRQKSSALAHHATVDALKDLTVESITNDNGPEFSLHDLTAKDLGIEIYFSRPYASWQRGTNENTNGLIRQYFPRGIDPCPDRVAVVESLLNNRPRKCLGYQTPNEIHMRLSQVLR